MPIRIPDNLPARSILEDEGVRVMDQTTAVKQDIRPLRIGLLNLMPNKIETETQFARLIGATPLQIELSLIHPTNHQSKTTPKEHLEAFYRTWSDIRRESFDGFIITGAPLGTIKFEDVGYWDELVEIFEWTRTNVHAPLFVCWGAMAALYHFHGVPKHRMDQKLFGVFDHDNTHPGCRWLLGFDDVVGMPVSRWSRVDEDRIRTVDGLRVLLRHHSTGPGLIDELSERRLYMINHLEYEANTLRAEFHRDLDAGQSEVPYAYFPDNDATKVPLSRWRAHGHLLVANWINEIYQSTPFDLKMIGKDVG